MYNSLIKWLDIPLTVKICTGIDGAGDKIFAPLPINTFCYPDGKITRVINRDGIEVISSKTLYIKESIGYNDICILDGIEYPVKALGTSFRAGVVDIVQVYV